MERNYSVQIGAELKIKAKSKDEAVAKVRPSLKVFMDLIPLSSKGIISKEQFWIIEEI
jgi:hypothetical protein